MNIKACIRCDSKCCRYFGLQLDTPKTKEEFENIRWFLAHEGVSVYIEKRKWYLEMESRCEFLGKDHLCLIYEKRPLICRDHDPSTCECAGGDLQHDAVFNNMAEFDNYLAKRFKSKKRRKRSAKRSSQATPGQERSTYGHK